MTEIGSTMNHKNYLFWGQKFKGQQDKKQDRRAFVALLRVLASITC